MLPQLDGAHLLLLSRLPTEREQVRVELQGEKGRGGRVPRNYPFTATPTHTPTPTLAETIHSAP